MRVIQLVAKCYGGIRRHVTDLMNCVATADHELWVLSRDAWRLLLLRRSRRTIVHCHGFRAAWAARVMLWNRSQLPPIIVTLHGMPGPNAGILRHHSLVGLLERGLHPVTSQYLVVSHHLAKELMALGVPPSKITVLPSPVDCETFTGSNVASAREALGVHPAELVTGFAGRLAREKGLDTALRAIAAGVRSGHNWRLVVAGEGPCRAELNELARQLCIEDRITWLGAIQHDLMPEFYRSIDVLLCPSRQEGQSLVALEALSCGTPVVGSKIGGLPETVTSDVGVCVPVDDPSALADVLAGPLSDKAHRTRLSEAATRHVRLRFSRKDWAQTMSQIYRGLIAIALILAGACLCVPGEASPSRARVIVVVADGLCLTDLVQDPILSEWASRGAIGLLNTATAGRVSRAAAWLTLGAGSRSRADVMPQPPVWTEDRTAWGENAHAAFVRRTGTVPPPKSLVSLEYQTLKTINRGLSVPGSLGSSLARHRVPITLLGGSGVPGEHGGPMFLAAADSNGVLSPTLVDGPFRDDSVSPFGRRLDEAAVADYVLASPVPGIVIVDYGDLWREMIEREASGSDARTRPQLVRALGRFLWTLTAAGTDHDIVIVASLVSDSLAPVVFSGRDFGQGALISGTTRRTGLISSTDIAPTILSCLGIPIPEDMTGLPVSSVTCSGDVAGQLSAWLGSATAVHRIRPTIVRGYVWLSLGALLGLAAVVVWPVTRGISAWLMLAMMAGPVAMITVPARSSVVSTVVTYGLLTAALTIAARALATRDWTRGPLLLCLLVSVVVIVDQALGARLALDSVLGYSPIAGARYYGLGNELAGVLLGSSIMAASLIGIRYGVRTARVSYVVGLLMTGLVVANPQAGANLGATISLASAWIALLLTGAVRTGLVLGGAVVGGVLVAVTAVGLDAVLSASEQSHLGRLTHKVMSDGLSPLWAVALRKVELNLRLVRYTVWSRALVAAVLALFVLSRWPLGAYRKMVSQNPLLARGVHAATLGAAVALVVNDSGIVTAATAMIYVAGVTGYALLSVPREPR